MKGIRIDDEKRAAILRDYLESKQTTQQVADRHGVAGETVRRIVHEHNGPAKLPKSRRALPATDDLQAIRALQEAEATGHTITRAEARAALDAIVSRDIAIERLILRLEVAPRQRTLNTQIEQLIAQVLAEESRANRLQAELDKLKGNR